MLNLDHASTPEDFSRIELLFLEYAAWLDQNDPHGIDLCFQGFDAELATLPGKYAPPQGRLYLASWQDELAGCVGMRPMEADVCEMKRLYVRPQFRGKGIGKHLVETIIQAGRDIGYRAMRLDTLPFMDSAIALYRRYGFRPIEAYYTTPIPETLFMELDLNSIVD